MPAFSSRMTQRSSGVVHPDRASSGWGIANHFFFFPRAKNKSYLCHFFFGMLDNYFRNRRFGAAERATGAATSVVIIGKNGVLI